MDVIKPQVVVSATFKLTPLEGFIEPLPLHLGLKIFHVGDHFFPLLHQPIRLLCYKLRIRPIDYILNYASGIDED